MSNGEKHDIVLLGHNVAQFEAQLKAYGLPDAVVCTENLIRVDAVMESRKLTE